MDACLVLIGLLFCQTSRVDESAVSGGRIRGSFGEKYRYKQKKYADSGRKPRGYNAMIY